MSFEETIQVKKSKAERLRLFKFRKVKLWAQYEHALKYYTHLLGYLAVSDPFTKADSTHLGYLSWVSYTKTKNKQLVATLRKSIPYGETAEKSPVNYQRDALTYRHTGGTKVATIVCFIVLEKKITNIQKYRKAK